MGSKEANGPDFLTPLTVQLLCQQWRTEDGNTMLGYKHEQAYRGFSNHIKKCVSSQKHTSVSIRRRKPAPFVTEVWDNFRGYFS